VILWDVYQNKKIKEFTNDEMKGLFSLKMNLDWTILMTGSDDGILRLWNTIDSEIISTYAVHKAPITSIDLFNVKINQKLLDKELCEKIKIISNKSCSIS